LNYARTSSQRFLLPANQPALPVGSPPFPFPLSGDILKAKRHHWRNYALIYRQYSQKDQVIDLTETVEDLLRKETKADGLCSLFVAHTTCALTTADLDPGTDLDLLDALRQFLPRLSYRHPHNPAHTPDHILSSLLALAGHSLRAPSAPAGTWQRVILVELDGPRQRQLHLSTF